MEKDLYEITYLKKLHIIPQWAIGMKTASQSIWAQKFIDAGYKATGWKFADGFGSWWDEYHNEKGEFIYASQCVRYTMKYN